MGAVATVHYSQNRDLDNGDNPPFEECAANARLIAAAPDLLEALVCMERIIVELYPGHLEPEPEHVGEYQAVWGAAQDARAAIAKATGGAA